MKIYPLLTGFLKFSSLQQLGMLRWRHWHSWVIKLVSVLITPALGPSMSETVTMGMVDGQQQLHPKKLQDLLTVPRGCKGMEQKPGARDGH